MWTASGSLENPLATKHPQLSPPPNTHTKQGASVPQFQGTEFWQLQMSWERVLPLLPQASRQEPSLTDILTVNSEGLRREPSQTVARLLF